MFWDIIWKGSQRIPTQVKAIPRTEEILDVWVFYRIFDLYFNILFFSLNRNI